MLTLSVVNPHEHALTLSALGAPCAALISSLADSTSYVLASLRVDDVAVWMKITSCVVLCRE
jgi:hypothetical protein